MTAHRLASTKVVATATVRAGNRRILPTRAALVLVSIRIYKIVF